MTDTPNPTPGDVVDAGTVSQAIDNHGTSQTVKPNGRPGDHTDDQVNLNRSDPTLPNPDVDRDHILRLATDPAMLEDGFKSLPNDDDEPTGGVGQKTAPK